MSTIHVLEQTKKGVYNVVLHAAVPGGSNTAGKTWQNVVKGLGLNVTALTEGTLPGQISTAEKASVEAGSVLEFGTDLAYDSTGGGSAEVLTEATNIINRLKGEMQTKYQRYGQELS
jgi:hypothetical protein